jgi:AhpC/TSA family/Disulphide bond corrector protein DsbC
VELQARLKEIEKQGLGLAAISYDSAAVLKDFAERRKITFPLLSDAKSKTIRAFGILNETVPAKSGFAGIPYPGTFIVDREGRVIAKYFEEDYTERYTASDILVRQFGATAGASQVTAETRHLKVTSAASSDHLRPSQRLALTLDIELKPNMHVYAPGVEGGYIAIEWDVTADVRVKSHDVSVPPSRKLHLDAIDETVPVYEGKFRLLRDITIAKSAKPGELVVEGKFRYQACDDRMCYVPVTVPLKWTLTVEKPDLERAPAALQKKLGG